MPMQMWRKGSFNTELVAMEVSAVQAESYVDGFKIKNTTVKGERSKLRTPTTAYNYILYVTLQMLCHQKKKKNLWTWQP